MRFSALLAEEYMLINISLISCIAQSFSPIKKMSYNNKKRRFPEAESTAVFTTRYVMVEKKPITYVTHEEEDGAWQFFSCDEFKTYEAVAMIVGLGEIVALDPSVLDLANMPVGYYAIRETSNEKWTIRPKADSRNVE